VIAGWSALAPWRKWAARELSHDSPQKRWRAMNGVEVRWSPFRFAVVPHESLTDARLIVMVAELRAILAKAPGRDPMELEPIVLGGGQAWASPNWDEAGNVVWTIYRPEDR